MFREVYVGYSESIAQVSCQF